MGGACIWLCRNWKGKGDGEFGDALQRLAFLAVVDDCECGTASCT